MSTIRAVTEADLPEADREQLLLCLKRWKAEGQTNPMIPCDIDVDGDGTTDAYALGPFGDLVYVRGALIGDTVYESTGDGFENTEPDTEDEDG
ncbi:hypothetical protein SEA_PERMAG_27 [Microbacterium phage PermaG]|nr:hypothetical protein SEA_PERMAG_27 [Microbacterium phage PermaG]